MVGRGVAKVKPSRLVHNVAWLGQLACYGAFAAVSAALLAMLRLPGYSLVNLLVAVWVTRSFGLAALAFAIAYAAARSWQRLVLGPAPRMPEVRKLTAAARQADIGRTMVAWYIVGGLWVLGLLSLADRGPFALAAAPLRPVVGIATPLAGFVLGCAALALSLVALATLPRADRWPVLAAAQDTVGPAPAVRQRRKRPARDAP